MDMEKRAASGDRKVKGQRRERERRE